ncbi:MAG: [FeFe] hydrogenase, group A [Candidatus Gottesmanbacteria bacterium]
METITITVNGKMEQVEEGQQLLSALKGLGYTIPAICYHPDFEPEENCRLCLVEVDGKIITSCSSKTKKDMIVNTDTEEILKLRKTNAELLIANYEGSDKSFGKTLLQKISCEAGVCHTSKFLPRKSKRGTFSFRDILTYDLKKCVDCRNCVKACQSQGVCAVCVKDYGYKEEIAKLHDRYCVFCGQCLAHCPAGAISTNPNMYTEVASLLTKKADKQVMVAQIAPAVRAAIGEEFGLPYGIVATEQLVEALKLLGFDYVFDTSVGADITTVEEAKELVERLKHKGKLPMFTSCCPGWVRYLGVYFPKLLPNLTSVHSPQIMMGGIIKWHWANKMHIPKEQVHVVSIMPCLAKKWESHRPEFQIEGLNRIDNVLTTVEIATMIKEKNIDLATLKGVPMDDPLGKPTGAGVIYGASGGVMVSALRTGFYYLTGKNPDILEFDQITTLDGYKTMEVKAPGLTLRIAALDGLGNVGKIINNLDAFDYIEIMACRGGCIGGGGQPIPVNDDIRKKRAAALFSIDKNSPIRFAHDNPAVQALYTDFLTDDSIIHKICHYTL